MLAPGSFNSWLGNLALAATVTHMILWNRDDIRAAWDWLAPSTLCRSFEYFTVETVKVLGAGRTGSAYG